jgi:hypothetical protein
VKWRGTYLSKQSIEHLLCNLDDAENIFDIDETKYCSKMVGYDAKNKDTINPLYLCRSCSLILREPFQLKCGHRQCKTCIESIEGYIKINY